MKKFLPFFSNKYTYLCGGVKIKIISSFKLNQQVANGICNIVYSYTKRGYFYGWGSQISRKVFYFIKESLKIIEPIEVIFKPKKKYFIIEIIKKN